MFKKNSPDRISFCRGSSIISTLKLSGFIVFCSLILSFFSFVKSAAAAASISLSPSSGYASSNFTISGSEFTASLGVTVTWDGNSLGGGTADGSGNISISKVVPSDATIGSHSVTVTSASVGKIDKKIKWVFIEKALAIGETTASTTFTVMASSTTSSPTPTISDSGSPTPSLTGTSSAPSTTPPPGVSTQRTTTPTASASTSVSPTDSTTTPASLATGAASTATKKAGLAWWWWLIFLILLLILIISGYTYYKYKKKQKEMANIK